MTGSAAGPDPDRFPGFDALSQRNHWDPVTTGVVLNRIGMAPDIRFFTPAEQATATVLCHHLLDQGHDPGVAVVPVVNLIDSRLAESQTDGWHYQDMPPDSRAWQVSLAALDEEAGQHYGTGFVPSSPEQQKDLIQAVQDLGSDPWHGMSAKHVWSLWTRYACTAFYSHPSIWNQMGFPGPAYPRGYKNAGVDSREPFEVRDAHPGDDPARSS